MKASLACYGAGKSPNRMSIQLIVVVQLYLLVVEIGGLVLLNYRTFKIQGCHLSK